MKFRAIVTPLLAPVLLVVACLDPSPRFDGLRRGAHQLVAADTSMFTDATEAFVASTDRYYRFAPGCAAADDGALVVHVAAGCWVSEAAGGSPRWRARALSFDLASRAGGFYVDAVAGDDEGDGSAADPVRTFAELVRRLGGQDGATAYDFAGRTGAGVYTVQIVSDTAEDLVVDGVLGDVVLALGVPSVLSSGVVTAVGPGMWDGGPGGPGWVQLAGVPTPAVGAPSVWLRRRNAADASETWAPVISSDGARAVVGQQMFEDAAPNLGVHYAGGSWLLAPGDQVDVVRLPRLASVVDVSLTNSLVLRRVDLGTYGAVWSGKLAAGLIGILAGQDITNGLEIRGAQILGNSDFGFNGSAIFFRGISAGAPGVPTKLAVSGQSGYFQRAFFTGGPALDGALWTGSAELELDAVDFTGAPQAIVAQGGEVHAQSAITGRGNVNGVRVESRGTVSGLAGYAGLFASCSGTPLLVDGVGVPPAPVATAFGTVVLP